MSSKKYATPLRLEIKPSKILFFLLLILHFLALLIIYTLNFDLLITVLIVIPVFISAYFSIFKITLQKSKNSIIKLVWDGNNEWILENKIGEKINAELLKDTYISSMMTILIFKCEGQFVTKNIVLLKDNIDENDFRRLRVRLKVGKPIEIE